MMKRMAAAIFGLALAGPGIAKAADDCHVSMNLWQPREAVQAMAAKRGWTVSRLKVDDGCYGLQGADETGRAFKARIDPATLEIVKFRHKYDDINDDDSNRHGSKHSQPAALQTGATGKAPSNALFETNSRSKVIVK